MEMRAGPQNCQTCGEPMACQSYGTTLVGYCSPDGHNHDDNCLTALYKCPNGHPERISHRRKCPAEGCDWKGREECFCHQGAKRGLWTNELRAERALACGPGGRNFEEKP